MSAGTRFVLEHWSPGPAAIAWTQIGADDQDRETLIGAMRDIALSDPVTYGPAGCRRLRVREVSR